MKKDPAFLFYPSDFLTGTMFMSNEQIGIYIRLLCSQHQHGGTIDKVSFNSLVSNHDIIRTKFIETDLGFYNPRLMEEMHLRNKKSNNISLAVKEVWEKRKNAIPLKNDAIPLQSQKNPKRKSKKSNEIPMGIVDINVNEVINYFKEKGYKEEIAIKAFNYYNEANWHDAKGNKVINWKQKMQSVWFKDENKITNNHEPIEETEREYRRRTWLERNGGNL
ncbi:MAG: DUF1376 domain-containing protein [Flavobacteriaceae bacterium]|nr:DUF1376 domain-containing protein [Flavobacteriaceae bacterium]